MKFIFSVGALALLWSRAVFATMYVAAVDPKTNAIGLAYSSSGAHFWQTRVKGKGLVGAQALGLCESATPEAFLKEGLTAKVIANRLYDQCHSEGWESYRLAVITADGAISSVIAAEGCTASNETCGELKGNDFLIIGGGLEKDTLEAGRKTWEKTNPEQPLECRLFQVLEAAYAAGGEKKNFRGASITVDYPELSDFQHWEARGLESELLPTLKSGMTKKGVVCQ